MRKARLFLVSCFLPCAATSSLAQQSPHAGERFSSDRLERITTLFQLHIDQGDIPGAVILISRDGKTVYQQALGYQDREKKTLMKPDAIFRIASMTKPITSVAVMMLAEQGRIDLLAPVSQYLLEFKDVRVGVEKLDPATNKTALVFETPRHPITVQDLLRHTSGIVYGFFGNTLVHQAYNNTDLFNPGQTLAEFVTKLSKLPLAHQPGTVWEYGMSTDVLSRIVEVVSGMPFDQFIEQHITTPLGMRDTAFYLSAAQTLRLAEMQIDPATGKRPFTMSAEVLTKEKMKWFSGGGGLLSTTSDYARFCQMLQNGGELGNARLLSPKTIAMMTSDQLLPGIPRSGIEDLAPTPELGQSFGLGFAVRTSLGPNSVSGSVGDYFWAGIYGTYFWIDPREKFFAILMMQIPLSESGYYRRALREEVYAALLH